MRVATLNVWGNGPGWPDRRAVIRRSLEPLDAELIALQEVVIDTKSDQGIDLLDTRYDVVHQQRRGADGRGVLLASSWPVIERYEFDLLVTPRVDPGDWLAQLLVLVVQAPSPVGTVIFASPKPSYQRGFEHEREQQAVLATHHLEELVGRHGGHVVVAGDFDASPETASMRFWQGLQSLNDVSVSYQDTWQAMHPPTDPGLTFDPDNPLMRGSRRQRPGRRLDYILIRCNDHGPTLDTVDSRLFLTLDSDGPASDHYGLTADLRPL